VRARLDDDLDTPGAIAAIDAAARRCRGEAATLLGVDLLGVLPTSRRSTTWRQSAIVLTRSSSSALQKFDRAVYCALHDRQPGSRSDAAARASHRTPSPTAVEDRVVEGLERLPADGPAILCPNHISFLDSAFLMLTVPRNISFVGKAEYMDSWKTKYLFPAMGMIPIDRSGGDRQHSGARCRRASPAAWRAVRNLPRGNAQPQRQPPQGTHRRGTSGDEARLPHLSRSASSAPTDPAARRQGTQAVQVQCEIKIGRPVRPERYRRSWRRTPRLAVDDRRGHVRDPRDDGTDTT
jgi:hypothetical protein